MPSSGGSPVSVISSSNPVTVDFASLMGSSIMLGSGSVPTGSYSQMTLTLTNPQMGMLTPGSNGMGYGTMNSSLAPSSLTVDLNPALQVSANIAVGLMLDMNVLKSVVLSNSDGTMTATINPTFQANGMSADQGSMMMQGLNALVGIVQSVDTTGSNSNFVGSLAVAQWMMGRTFTVNVTSQTTFQGVSGLSTLAAGTFVEVQASVDGEGNLVANQVDAQGQTNGQQGMGGFMGVISSVTRDASGNTTQFQLGMNQEFPDMRSMMGLFAQPQVTLGSGATFQIGNPAANFAQLTFDATTAGLGQLVTVIGQVTGQGSGGMMGGNGGMMGGGGSLAASSVVLQTQPLLGTFNQVLVAGSDDKTGGFSMTPCSSVFGSGSISIPVLTSSRTNFNGLNGLNGIPSNSELIVNGLLLYEPNLTKANGVPLTPPGWVFEAVQVRAPQ